MIDMLSLVLPMQDCPSFLFVRHCHSFSRDHDAGTAVNLRCGIASDAGLAVSRH